MLAVLTVRDDPTMASSTRHPRLDGFGARLAALRQGRGLTQAELGAAAGVSQRVIAYYETESTQPPGALLVDLARALRCTTDALLGVTAPAAPLAPRTARLLKRPQRIEELPRSISAPSSKRVDSMLNTQRRSTRPARPKRKAS